MSRFAGWSSLRSGWKILGGSLLISVALVGATQATEEDQDRSTRPIPSIADTLEVDGGGLYYEVFGDGYPLVFIHDGLAHSEVWDNQVMAFAHDYRVIRYDRRGYGRSPEPESSYSNIEDLHTLLDSLAIPRAVLFGCSSGGGLAIDFTLEHPELVEALVLSGPVVSGLGYSLHFMERAYGNFGPDLETTIERWAADPYSVAPGNYVARWRLREILLENPHNMGFGKHRLAQPTESAALGRLGEITVPTLLIVGDLDTPDVHAHVGAIEAGIVGARRVVLAGAGHLPCLERPDEFNHQVQELLSLLTLAPGSPRVDPDDDSPWQTFTNGFAPVEGTALYYESMGDGDSVILLHGGAIDHRMWDAQFTELADRYRVVRYDIRGHGLSLSPFGIYCNYEDLRGLLAYLDLGRTHMIGLSLGCRVAADLAIAYPEAVASLILCSPGLSGSTFDAPEEQAYLERFRAAWGSGDFAQAAEEFVCGWCDGPHRTPEEVRPDVRTKIKAMALETMRPDRDRGQGVELDPPAIGRLGEIEAPTLAVLGALDMPGIHEIVRRIEEDVPEAKVVTLSDAAHMVNLERTKKFNRTIIEFLKKQNRQ